MIATRSESVRFRLLVAAALACPIVLGACRTTTTEESAKPPTEVPVGAGASPEAAAAPPAPAPSPPPPARTPAAPAAVAGLKELFPGVRVDAAAKLVEFDATLSPLLTPDPRAPLFYLELIACSPDTREHESLIVSRVRPSHIHAAMLLIGLKPGTPGRWKMENDRLVPIDATGDRVEIRFVVADTPEPGRLREIDPLAWIVSARDQRGFAEATAAGANEPSQPSAPGGWVFAGSRIVSGAKAMNGAPTGATPPEVYEADETGTIIGLTSFGSEMISWSRTISPDAGIDTPEWVAKMDGLPAAGSPIVVRIRPAP